MKFIFESEKMATPHPGIKAGIDLIKTIYKALEKLQKEIAKEEDDKFVANLVKEIHRLYLAGKDARSSEIQLILNYLRNLGVDIALLDLRDVVKVDLLTAAAPPLASIVTSTDIKAALAARPKVPAKPTAKKASAKPVARKAAAKPAAKKVAAKKAAKPALKKAAAKPVAKKAAAKPAAKKVAARKAAARPMAAKKAASKA